jgi:hypothetical protein
MNDMEDCQHRVKFIKIGGRLVPHARRLAFQFRRQR